MNKFGLVILLFLVLIGVFIFKNRNTTISKGQIPTSSPDNRINNPLSIEMMRKQTYPGSEVVIEEELADAVSYRQFIASYKSEGLKIYALLTVPIGEKPSSGWPVIIFNHGYIPPDQYRTKERYGDYVDAFARNGYIVFKPDYRGNGKSEGEPEGAYYSPAYATDVLNAIASIKKLKDPSMGSGRFVVDTNRIGMWGHSMGGNITLRDLEVSSDIKAAVIWGGVVGSYYDLMNNWQRKVSYRPPARELALRNRSRQNLVAKYGTPDSNGAFWDTIDPFKNLQFITAPIQLHHGLADEEVPVAFSEKLNKELLAKNKTVEYYTYEGADHNISGAAFTLAMRRSVDFFDKYLK